VTHRISARWVALLAAGGGAFAATPVGAHGFGQRYDLPIPLSFYVIGAGATVALSFVMAVLFLQPPRLPETLPPLPLLRSAAWRRWANCIAATSRALAAAYFILMIAAGLFGAQAPLRNIIVVSVWIVGWVVISLCSALVGDVWRILNPWDTIFATFERIYVRLRPGRSFGLAWTYPPSLATWPAVVLFLAFAWMELIWDGRDVPARLAWAMLFYSAITWAGMFVFGRTTWCKSAEVFTIVFGIFARFAPLAVDECSNNQMFLRLPADGLIENQRNSWAMVLLVISLLATVTFDGLLETPLWAYVDIAIINTPDDSLLWAFFGFSEAAALRVVRTVGLIMFILLFSAAFIMTCSIMAAVTHGKGGGPLVLAPRFVFSLLPISIAYHIAHYFSYLFNSGQLIIPLISDPFGFGWDLFGTAAYQPNIGFVGPILQWYVAVAAIVVGHVIAVCLAHLDALAIFGNRRLAMRSQLSILVLMVGYTMLSLWILSQPIVETSSGS